MIYDQISAEILEQSTGLGTEQEKDCRTARHATQAGGIDSLKSIPGQSLKISSQEGLACYVKAKPSQRSFVYATHFQKYKYSKLFSKICTFIHLFIYNEQCISTFFKNRKSFEQCIDQTDLDDSGFQTRKKESESSFYSGY